MSLLKETIENEDARGIFDPLGVFDEVINTPHTAPAAANPPAYMPSEGDYKSKEAARKKKKKLASRRGRASTVQTPVSGSTLG